MGLSDFRFGPRKGKSPLSVFRQLLASGGIEFNFLNMVKVKLQEHDLTRIHNIIHEIDDHRAFYDAIEDQHPDHMIASVRNTKDAIHRIRQGLWANDWAREEIQILLHHIGDFLTEVERAPLPNNFQDESFTKFADAAEKLQMQVWSFVAQLVVVFGSAVKPLHLPPEILTAAQRAYDEQNQPKKKT